MMTPARLLNEIELLIQELRETEPSAMTMIHARIARAMANDAAAVVRQAEDVPTVEPEPEWKRNAPPRDKCAKTSGCGDLPARPCAERSASSTAPEEYDLAELEVQDVFMH